MIADESEILEAIRVLGRRGEYSEAALYAASLGEPIRRLPLMALELCRVRLRQGRVNEASTALAAADMRNATSGEILILSMEAAALRIYRETAIRQAVDEAAAIWAARNLDELDLADEAEAERINSRILLIASVYREVPADVGRQARDRLPMLAETLAHTGRTDESLSARLTWAEKQDENSERQKALSDFAARALRMNRVDLAGEAHLLKAENLLAAGAPNSEIETELDAAASLYEQAGHLHGPTDVRRVRAKLAIEREAAPLSVLEHCLDEYHSLDFPRGEISLLMDLSQVAHERGRTADADSYRRRSLALAEKTGMGLARDNYRLAQMDLLMRANRYREAIELGQAALAAGPVASLAASYEQLLATAFSFVEDFRAAYRHGRRAVDLFTELGMDESASVAALKLASDLTAARRDEEWDEAESVLGYWLEKDEQRADWAGAAQKRELIAQIPLLRFSFSPRRRGDMDLLDRAERELAAAESLAARVSGREGVRRRGAVRQLRGQLLQNRGDQPGIEQTWREAMAIYESAGLALEAANCHYMVGVLRLNLANQNLQANFSESEDRLRTALNYYEHAGMRERSADTRKMFAMLYKNAGVRVTDELKEQLLVAALGHLAEGERDYDEIRRDYAVGTALDAQLGKQTLIRKSRQIYELALEILTVGRRDSIGAWRWNQRAKARALGDLLGGAEPPARIMAELTAHPESLTLVNKERELAARVAKAPHDERQHLRAEMEEVRRLMEQDQHLTDYLEFRTGSAIDLNDVAAILSAKTGRQKSCVCVDWFSTNGRLWMVTLRPGNQPELWPMTLSERAAYEFVTRNLTPEVFRDTLRDTPELLREMDELIGPLAACSARDELLILSPTGPLHALPLHALELNGEALLARNPVVYSPSLSVLRYCMARRREDGYLRTAALFGDPSGDRAEAGELVNELACDFGTTALVNDEVKRDSFAAQIAGCDLIHFQGHAIHDRNDPLDSYLALADGHLTARDVFGLSGLRADLVTLAACESAASVIAAGDEPLGLIPAFLYAGANAVLATLWRVHRSSSTQLMRHFYSVLTEPESVVDKAQALRAAALAVRSGGGDYATPYHWAPFVLHGDWRN